MGEIKAYVMMAIGGLLTLLAPIQNFMLAMVLLFVLNAVFGTLADRFDGKPWDWKKAVKFFWLCFLFFLTVCLIFLVGLLLGEKDQSVAVVKIFCIAAVWIFGCNIFRNWRNLLVPGTPWYKLVNLGYWLLSVEFVEKFPLFKKFQDAQTKGNHNTILDKDDF